MPNFNPNMDQANWIPDTFAKLNNIVMAGLTLAIGIFPFFDTKGLINYFVTFPIPLHAKWMTNLITFYIICSLSSITTLHMFLAFTYGYYMVLFYTVELRLGQNNYKTCKQLRENPANLRNEYRAIQVLHLNFLALSGLVFLFLMRLL